MRYKKDINWFFFASTSHVYPTQKKKISEKNKTKPSSKYGKTKLLAENYIKKKLKNKKFGFCIGRIFSIFDNKESRDRGIETFEFSTEDIVRSELTKFIVSKLSKLDTI